MKKLRAYQQDAVQAAWDAWLGGERAALIVMASGLGKRVVSARLARKWWTEVTGPRRRGRILFMMHMREGLVQAREEFEDTFRGLGISTGLLTGWEAENLDADVLFATFQRMGNALMGMDPHRFGLLIVDEAHHGQAPTYRQVIEYFQSRLRIGLTATPERMDGLDIRDLFGESVYDFPLVRALQDGQWLARVDYKVMNSNISRQALVEMTGRLERGDRTIGLRDIDRWLFLKEKLDEEVRVIQNEQEDGNKQCIIFCRSHHHIREACARYPGAEPYHTDLSPGTLRARFAAFRRGEIRTLVAVDKLNEAIDIPDAELIVFLRTTCSKRVWLQQLGRGLRKIPGKDRVVVLDFVANTRRLLDIASMSPRGENPAAMKESVELVTGWTVRFTKDIVDVIDLIQRFTVRFYPAWEEASAAAQALGIKSCKEYKRRYREDGRLPSNPDVIYIETWRENGGYSGFLGRRPRKYYPNMKEASRAVRALKISRIPEYNERRSVDPMLPPSPDRTYSSTWKDGGGWPGFFGRATRKRRIVYGTWEDASAAAKSLGLRTEDEYRSRYRKDPKLPAAPRSVYANVWGQMGGLPAFLGRPSLRRESTPSYEQCVRIVRKMKIGSSGEYAARYREDPSLPSNPWKRFPSWDACGGWSGFLGAGVRARRSALKCYSAWAEASMAARSLGIRTSREYRKRFREDPKLHYKPRQLYADVWEERGGWSGFLGKK